jgi:hypothetical protein
LPNIPEDSADHINKEKTTAISFHHPQKVQVEGPSIRLNDTDILNSWEFG